ncbi:MAG: hypothetical protein E2O39_01340 [Planctomycetota bacterium]|nr:MAG: hypothetical protein E2O39_01340 [Planctomycetota bacterium]
MMEGIRNILVGVALVGRTVAIPPGSRNAFDQAIRLAKDLGARLTILHSTWVDEGFEPLDGEARTGVSPGRLDLPDEGRALLAGLASEAREHGLACELEVAQDRPWIAAIQAVLSGRADLVIVGKRDGVQGRGRRLGNVAAKLIRKCPAPLWVVKPDHDLVHKLVLAATELRAVGRLAVEYAGFVAACHAGELHVVHAFQLPPELELRSASLSEDDHAAEIDAFREERQTRLLAEMAESGIPGVPEVHVLRNEPSGAIRETVEHLHPDLLVMGSLSRCGAGFRFVGPFMGTTAERLLDRVDCSMLMLKPAEFVSPVALDAASR